MVQSLEMVIFLYFKANMGYFKGVNNAFFLFPAQIKRNSV